MKKLYVFFISVLMSLILGPDAYSYTIVSHSIIAPPDSLCNPPSFYVALSGYTPGLKVETSYGDGTASLLNVVNASTPYVTSVHAYATHGVYTIKHVVINGTIREDSISYSYDYQFCNSFFIRYYLDDNTNCIFDYGESFVPVSLDVEVDSAGVPIDTISVIGGFRYPAMGPVGTIYAFKVITPPSLNTTCSSTIILDTISTIVNSYGSKDIGFECSSASAFDLGVDVAVGGPGIHKMNIYIHPYNEYCSPVAAVATLHFSPKYQYQGASPAPATVSGNTITWNLPAFDLNSSSTLFVVELERPSPWLTPGDTVHTTVTIVPVTGDLDTTNNKVVRVDTVKASWDPNAKAVSPQGFIDAGTNLRYTVMFENTGNDTAENIHIQDTLSDNVDASSLKLISSSTPDMTITESVWAGHRVVKFDFPHIKLPDSSHHGLCDGFVTFTVNTKTGLSLGTQIHNRVGIYFDENEVVMTNKVTNTIGWPIGVEVMNNVPQLQVYPNPVTDVLTINTGSMECDVLEIMDITGQVVFSMPCKKGINKMDIGKLRHGIYILTLKGEKEVSVSRFEKQ